MRRFMLFNLRRPHRGSNAIELFFSITPILFMTLAFVQFYFLATEAYFGTSKGYSKAFKEAYQADSTDDTDDKLGTDDMEGDVFIIPVWRPLLGNVVRRNWDPPGDLHMGSDGEYWVAGGSQADWWEVWDPAIGLIGVGMQYIDFPWGSASFSGLHPYNAADMVNSGVTNTGAMANAAEDAKDEADEATEEAREEACEDMQENLSEQIALRNKANACRSPSIWVQMNGPGGPLYYEDGDEGPGEDLFYMVDPPGDDDPDPSDLVPAYPPAYYACTEDDYTQNPSTGDDKGFYSAAQAQSDYNLLNQKIAETQTQMAGMQC